MEIKSIGKNFTAAQIKRSMLAKGYVWYEEPYRLNLVGIRNASPKPNSFDDMFIVVYNDGQKWVCLEYRCTTDPGAYWLLDKEKKGNAKGTAILAPGQYIDSWKLGLHQQTYEALIQCKPVTVIRDANRDLVLNFESAKLDTGIFYINIHRANEKWESVQVDKWSAGCQVIANPVSFKSLIALCKEQVRIRKHEFFTYTLLQEKDLILLDPVKAAA